MYTSKLIKPERRSVTVIFGDIKGFTSLSEFLDPEDLQELIDKIFKEFKEIIERNGGYLDKFIGDAVMAVFGAPVAYGDDARRAILTSIAMQKYLEKLNSVERVNIKMRIGVNTGEVLWSSIAGEKPTVLGDTVNVAQRIEEIAGPGKIYVTESLVNLTFQDFYFKEIGLVRVKGREEPIHLFEVLGEKSMESEFFIQGRFKTPFSGREAEMESILGWIKGSVERPGVHIGGVVGEAGIGKTRFCAELKGGILTEFPDIKTFYLRCDSIKQTPMYAVEKILQDILGRVISGVLDITSVAHYLENKHGFSKNDAELVSIKILSVIKGDLFFSTEVLREIKTEMQRIFEAALGDLGSVVVFLDDAQFVDRESKNFFIGLKEEIRAGSLIFIFISRELLEEVDFDYSIELTGMGEGFVKEVCRSVLQSNSDEISDEFLSMLLAKTRGNPYFIEELVYYLRERDLLVYGPLRIKAEDFSMPESINSVLVAFVDRLPEDEKDLIKAASVIGNHFWKNILAKVLQRSVESSLNMLEKEGFIISQGFTYIPGDYEYIFRNELLKDAIYSLLTRKEKERLHSIVAVEFEKLEGKDEHLLFLTASHFEKSNNGEKATEYYEMAGDVAFSKGFYSYALQAYRSLKVNPEVAYKIAQCLEGMGEYEDALDILSSNVSALGDGSILQLRYEILMSSIYEKLSKFDEAFRYLCRASESSDPEIKAYANYKKAWVYWRMDDLKDAATYGHLSIKTIESFGLSSRDALKTLGADFNLLGNIEQINGNLSEAISYYDRAKLIFEEIGEFVSQAKILINVSQIYLSKWELEVAEEHLVKALDIVKKTGSRFLLAVTLNNLGRVFLNRQQLDEARHHFEEARKIFRDLKLADYLAETTINLAGIYLELYGYEKVADLLDEVLLLSPGLPPSKLGILYLLKGVLAYCKMDFNVALEVFKRVEEIFFRLDNKSRIFQVRVYQAAIKALLGDYEGAKQMIIESRAFVILSDSGLRNVESLINAGLVQYLCGMQITYPDLETLSAWFDSVKRSSPELRLSWLTLFLILGGERMSSLSSLLKEENLRLIIDIDNFPRISDPRGRVYLFGMLREHGAHLLLAVLQSFN
ncbi:MAG TPA: adenylate/guanylate cyclase domain-containing protein [Candidatus Hydrothermia bacterium]|nr:adenylate/guanylate cyclase domain-containing protein [Candidatus Hydrothermia bacterium]HOL23912.1 adenylate/guanylate cyclase domain-containing protein [Candidatus Hydrothermia bacterium]HPO78917.1 adenylate/guanylate cyclase domain-containing protein [Candidatus Hydrothermia bacterium]